MLSAIAVTGSILSTEPATTPDSEPTYNGPIVISIVAGLAILGVGIATLVHAIRGGIRAGRGEVYRAVGAIRFLDTNR